MDGLPGQKGDPGLKGLPGFPGQEGADVFKVTISLEPQSLPIFCAVVPSMPAVDMSALRIGMDIRIDVRIEIQAS